MNQANHNGIYSEAAPQQVLIAARSGTLFQSLARTLEEQLVGCSVSVCESPEAFDMSSDVRLVLIYEPVETDLAAQAAGWKSALPDAALALLIDDVRNPPAVADTLFNDQLIQGVLPLTLKLEVWLAAVSLLMSGGDYYPSVGSRGGQTAPVRANSAPSQWLEARPQPMQLRPALPALTHREHQILELLSEGYQNKLIAHKMSLSEHTVKVHVHNLLSKLRVNNRTQAAAAFRDGRVAPLRTTALMKARGLNGSSGNPAH